MFALGNVLPMLEHWFLVQDDQLILFYVCFLFRHQRGKIKNTREVEFSAFLIKVFEIFYLLLKLPCFGWGNLFNYKKIKYPLGILHGFLSPEHGAYVFCGWTNGVQYGR